VIVVAGALKGAFETLNPDPPMIFPRLCRFGGRAGEARGGGPGAQRPPPQAADAFLPCREWRVCRVLNGRSGR